MQGVLTASTSIITQEMLRVPTNIFSPFFFIYTINSKMLQLFTGMIQQQIHNTFTYP